MSHCTTASLADDDARVFTWSCTCEHWRFELVLASCEEELRSEDEIRALIRAHTDGCVVLAATRILGDSEVPAES